MITKKDFPSLSTRLDEIFNESTQDSLAMAKGFDVFEVAETDRKDFKFQILHGVAGVRKVTPGQDLPRVDGIEGDDISYSQAYYGAIVPVTKENRKFDEYDEIDDIAASITEDAWDKVDQSLADVLLNGWANSYTDVWGETITATGPDGVMLFNANHTNPASSRVFSNLINDGTNNNPTFSREAIANQIARGRGFKDVHNLSKPVIFDTLLIPSELEDAAIRYTETIQLPGTPNNDTNKYVTQTIKQIIVWERLSTRSDGTDTSAYWFMLSSKKVGKSLKCKFAERPTLDAPEQVYSNKNWDWSIDFFYARGIGYPQFVAGSNSSNA